MGIDAYAHLESIRDDKWIIHQTSFYSDRNYLLFALLADIRNDGEIPCIDSKEGVPENASKELVEITKELPIEYDVVNFLVSQVIELKERLKNPDLIKELDDFLLKLPDIAINYPDEFRIIMIFDQ